MPAASPVRLSRVFLAPCRRGAAARCPACGSRARRSPPDEPPARGCEHRRAFRRGAWTNVLAGDRRLPRPTSRGLSRRAHALRLSCSRSPPQTETIRPEQRPEEARTALADLADSGLTSDVLAMHDFEWSLAAFRRRRDAAEAAVGDAVDLDTLVRDIADPRYRLAAFVDLGAVPSSVGTPKRASVATPSSPSASSSAVPTTGDRVAGAQAVLRLLIDAGPPRLADAAAQAIALMPSASDRAKASADLAARDAGGRRRGASIRRARG